MGKRIELTEIYRPAKARTIEKDEVAGSSPAEGRVSARAASLVVAQTVERILPSVSSKPGPKPKIEVPADVQAWLTKHGLRVVPKERASK
jgi:hypothetical protein